MRQSGKRSRSQYRRKSTHHQFTSKNKGPRLSLCGGKCPGAEPGPTLLNSLPARGRLCVRDLRLLPNLWPQWKSNRGTSNVSTARRANVSKTEERAKMQARFGNSEFSKSRENLGAWQGLGQRACDRGSRRVYPTSAFTAFAELRGETEIKSNGFPENILPFPPVKCSTFALIASKSPR